MVTCVQILALILACLAVTHAGPPKKSSLGYEMGDLNDIQGVGIKGKVIFADKSTILLKNFFYGYPAPDMFFWADHNKFTDSGLKIPSRSGLDKLDSDYNGSDVTLKLPAGKSLKDYNIFGMFCKTYAKEFSVIKYEPKDLIF
uniref:DM13 domain-containing protein n=1 Tax=Romanomermis culicivorax TaxID=13658 RepID=A0A915KVN9_ROMCU